MAGWSYAKAAGFNSDRCVEDHWVDVNEMVETKKRKRLAKSDALAKKKPE